VAGAYLFGSILGPCRFDSDVDLGIILEQGIRPDSTEAYNLEADISILLTHIDGHIFDIVMVDSDKPLFAFKIIKGKQIYCKNRERVLDVVEFVSRCYADLYPRYRRALEEVFKEVLIDGH